MTIKTIKFKSINNSDPEKDREVKGLIIAVSLFTAGIIIGAGLLKSSTFNNQDFISLFDNFIQIRAEQKIYQLFSNSLAINILFIFIINFAATSCVGIPFAVGIPVIKGLGTGIVAGYLFSEFTINGIGYYLLTILPGSVISNTAILLACNDACFLSADILATVLSKKQPDSNILKNYLKRNIIIIILTISSALIECLAVKAFAYMFIF